VAGSSGIAENLSTPHRITSSFTVDPVVIPAIPSIPLEFARYSLPTSFSRWSVNRLSSHPPVVALHKRF